MRLTEVSYGLISDLLGTMNDSRIPDSDMEDLDLETWDGYIVKLITDH